MGTFQQAGAQQPYGDEHLIVDFDHRAVLLDQQIMKLARKEYDLLALLVRHAGEIMPRPVLLQEVWEYKPEIKTRTVDVHVRRLRKKLGPYAERYIETVLGTGYRFQPYHAARFFQFTASNPPVAVSA